MLMMIGPVQFEVLPFNTSDYGHGHEAGFAEKPLLGARPELEFVGEGAETWSVRARLFPEKFGGLASLDLLYQARSSGRAQYMMRGDGRLMGWVAIRSVRERASHLDAQGVGRVIDVDISVQRTDGPSEGGFFSALADVFV